MVAYLFILNLLTLNSASYAADDPILQPRIYQLGGGAAQCLQKLLEPRLLPGQRALALTGPMPNPANQSVVSLTVMSNPPIERYQIHLETTEGSTWEYFNYRQGQRTIYGFKADKMNRLARVDKFKPGLPFGKKLEPIDLTPCEIDLVDSGL